MLHSRNGVALPFSVLLTGKSVNSRQKNFGSRITPPRKKKPTLPTPCGRNAPTGRSPKLLRRRRYVWRFQKKRAESLPARRWKEKSFPPKRLAIIKTKKQHQQQTKKNTTKIHDVEPEKPRPDPNAAAREFAEKTIKNMDRASNADKLAAWLTDPQNTQARADIMAVSADLGNALEAAIKAACDRLGIKTDTLGQDVVSSVRLGRDIPLTPDADIPSLDESFPGDRVADNSIRNKNNGISKQQNY